MRVNGRQSGRWKKEPTFKCGSIGYAVGPTAGSDVRIRLYCDSWYCLLGCRKRLAKKWMSRIEKLPGAVIYVAQSKLQKNKLSSWIQRHIGREKQYICAHLNDESLVLSNANFRSAEPRNKKKFSEEIREMMESGKITNMSKRRDERKEVPDQQNERYSSSWSFAVINEKIINEYRHCQTDYERGLFLQKYRYTGQIYRVHKLGEDLLYKIERGEINEIVCNLQDLCCYGGLRPPSPPGLRPSCLPGTESVLRQVT